MTDTKAMPRAGIIGLGGIGRTHIAAWKANGITPVAFSDTVPALLDAAIETHGGTPYTDPVALIQSGTVDIVSICTPPAFHADLAVSERVQHRLGGDLLVELVHHLLFELVGALRQGHFMRVVFLHLCVLIMLRASAPFLQCKN